MRKLISLLGSPLDILSMEETIDRMMAFVAIGRATHRSHQVATVNVDFLVKALVDPELRFILQDVDMATIDGMPLVWGSRWLGSPVTERVAGSDFVPKLAWRAAQEGLSIFLLGATPEVSARAAEKLVADNPGLVIAGVISPPFQPILEMDPGIVAEIKAADPDILLVAFGNPKQEKWIEVYGPQVNVPLMIGVGATLDFLAGEMKRAPRWLQRVGLEWFFRMLQEPRRLVKRYAQDIWFFTNYFARQAWLQHPSKGKRSQPAHISCHNHDRYPTLTLKGVITAQDYDTLWKMGQVALEQSCTLLVDLKDCTFLDSSAMGALMGIAKLAHDQEGQMTITAASPKISRIISFHKLDHLILASPAPNHTATQIQGSNNQELETSILMGTGQLVVKAPGRLDGKSSHQFGRDCSKLLEQNPRMIINLANTFHVSSAGLAVFEQLTHQAESCQGYLNLIACTPNVSRVIKNQNFDRKLTIYPDLTAILGKEGW